MKTTNLKSLTALHTHTHTYSLVKKRGVNHDTSL